MDKVSDKYPVIEKAAVGSLAGKLDSLVSVFDDGSYRLIELNADTIGLCGSINTFAKTKSPLQRLEPVVVGINKTHWQTTTPFVFPDRPDFPFTSFPHVNYSKGTLPATLCLSREDIDDWYAEHTLADYMDLVAQWLRDAAKGKLMKINENDEFEPQRVHNADHFLLRASYMDSFLQNEKEPSCHLYSITILKDTPFIAYGNEQHEKLHSNGIGVRLFAGKDKIDGTWYSEYPTTVGEFYNWIQTKGYPLDNERLKNELGNNKEYVYFQLALLRPVKIIGKNTCINYLCFRAKASDILSSNLTAPVEEVSMIDYTDYTQAKYLSNTPDSIFCKHVCILGCGAVGSKIASHLHRGGVFNIDLVDNDNVYPHNMVRHALSTCTPTTFLTSKAKAMQKHLSEMFFDMPTEGIKAFDCNALEYLAKADLSQTDLVIDATASAQVMYGIDNMTFTDQTLLARVALSEGGDVGITYLNYNRQPFADFYMEILRTALSDNDVFKWLSNEKKNSMENVRIGEGCHSNTMRISDDTISAHAALMSSAIRHIYEGEQANRIILTWAHRNFPGSMQTSDITVKPYLQFQCANNTSWIVRIPEDLLAEIRLKAKIAGQKENGGYLFGHIDYKRKVVYPLNHYMPRDSRGTKTGFRLGTSGLKDYKKAIAQRSVGQMEYIGDWHSHTTPSLEMSETDITTCSLEVKPELKNRIGLCVITKAYDTKFYLIS